MHRAVVIICWILATLIFSGACLLTFFVYMAFALGGDISLSDRSVQLAMSMVGIGSIVLGIWAGWRIADMR